MSAAMPDLDNPGKGVRAITDEEVAHYREHGWVKLAGFMQPWLVEELLAHAQAKMGADPLTLSSAAPKDLQPNEFKWYERWDGPSHHDEWINKVSHSKELATAAARLMGLDAVRFYFDHYFVKVPVEGKGGTETPWHQDFPHHPLDRMGALTVWTPLVECPPEKGTMRFLNGSHQVGSLGRYLNRYDGVNLLDENPWVAEKFDISPPLHLMPGDATVHHLGITHYAPPNTTDSPRWVYVTQWLPPSVRFTGAPNHRTDGLGLEIDKPLDHPRFPVITV
ncbi:phytanoyl-CoA dioxygenase family protein [Sphaerimonospora sp. CA-214678]|uniref:phytanoyl-CoA dioxygenase family protein n=1 Tax=Sphaerimonospora sp. CA-214678 TaxID=3240029 RepID=UPI003D8E263A